MEGKNSGLINRNHKWQMQKGFTVSLIKRGYLGWGWGYLGAKRREIIRSLGKWRGHNKLCETGSQEAFKRESEDPIGKTNKGMT